MKKLLAILRRIIHLFTKDQVPAVRYYSEPDDPLPGDNLPPGYNVLETQVRGRGVPGTSYCWIGEVASVWQTPTGEMVTCERGKGELCGCGHHAFSQEEIVTETGVHRGIGGTCHDCSAEAKDKLARNEISLQQAERQSLYCTQCASHCDGCGRHNLCSRHTKLFTDADGQQQLLCPDCIAKADRKKFFKQTAAVFNWLLADDDKSSKSNRPGDSHGY